MFRNLTVIASLSAIVPPPTLPFPERRERKAETHLGLRPIERHAA
jgi:hypothetical protein